jgi:hypothetical protein
VNSAPLLDKRSITVPSEAAGVMQVADVDDAIDARVTLVPNLQNMPDKKFAPKIVTTDPPAVAPMLGVTATATSAAAYSNEVETARSAPLFKTSSETTAGEETVGEIQMTAFSDTKTADGENIAPNLQRMALFKILLQ